MQEEKRYLTADDVAKIVGCSKPAAYKLIQQCNDELQGMGKFVIRGKVNKNYFLSRIEM